MTTANRMRADRLLVERGLFESRAKAQDAIAAGLVTANGAAVRKPSEEIATDADLQASPAHPYVSRGGVKLAAALDHFGFDPQGRVCLDVGASTGGFTQVLVARGARRVYAVDVGRAQLHASLRGRAPGQVAELLRQGALEGGAPEERIVTKLSEPEAVETALGLAQPGDLVVIFADDVTHTWKQVIYWGKERQEREKT